MSKKLLCEIVGDKEKADADKDSVTVTLPVSKPVTVNVTVKSAGDPKKEESTKGRKQLLG